MELNVEIGSIFNKVAGNILEKFEDKFEGLSDIGGRVSGPDKDDDDSIITRDIPVDIEEDSSEDFMLSIFDDVLDNIVDRLDRIEDLIESRGDSGTIRVTSSGDDDDTRERILERIRNRMDSGVVYDGSTGGSTGGTSGTGGSTGGTGGHIHDHDHTHHHGHDHGPVTQSTDDTPLPPPVTGVSDNDIGGTYKGYGTVEGSLGRGSMLGTTC